MTKQEQATKIVAANSNKTRKEVIELIRSELNMTDAGASTYYYNAQKKLAAADKTNAVNEELAAAAPKKFQKTIKTVVDNTDDYLQRQSNLRAELNGMLNEIDLSEIPAFLRKPHY